MSISIDNIEIVNYSQCKATYDDFVSNQETLLYTSPQYLALLSQFLKETPKVMLLNSDGQIKGVVPFLEKRGRYGTILNSLPFYGSNGGCISQDERVQVHLLNALEKYARSDEIEAATIINNPLVDPNGYDLECDFIDKRMGQFTFFNQTDNQNLDESLMDSFHYKTRNMVRKAMKLNVKVTIDNNMLDYVIKLHRENMKAIGGIEKPESFFRTLVTIMSANEDYNIFVASIENKPIAALLLLYHKNIVEYFTPVIDVNYRSYQPMSILIFEAMKKAIKDGKQCWNWGGTWESQESVYRFKNRWGSMDKPYYYYTYINNQDLRNLSSEELLKEYPNFFVIPFKELIKS